VSAVDRVVETIVGYVIGQRDRPVSDAALREASRRVMDSLGCAIAAMDSPPARIARGLAAEFTGTLAASVIGLDRPASVDLAAFADTAMIRYLDANDTYFTPRGGGGHPSDLIGAALAVGEAVGASGYDVLRSVVAGYEVIGALASGVWLRERGWDQGLNVVAATAMMAGDLLGLNADQLRHALALAVTPHVPVRQTRVGRLSMWKGCATAGAVRDGVFAALLAWRGMTGPPEPYVGRSGLWELVTGEFEVTLPIQAGRAAVEDTSIKMRPAEFNAQAAIDLAIGLHGQFALDDIADIEIATYWLAWHEIGMDPAKWNPGNRETADHSLPYLVAVALADGAVNAHSCSPGRMADPSLHKLLGRIQVIERPEYTARFPAEFNVELTIALRDGRRIVRHAAVPHGHPSDPATDAELDAKFDHMTGMRPESERRSCEQIRRAARDLADAKDLAELGALLRSLAPAREAAQEAG
jgi:2-methylcitrate dehydratase